MGTYYVGENSKICQVMETTLGTAITSEVDADAIWLPAEFPLDITPSVGLIMQQGLGGDHRATGAAYPGNTTVKYPITMKMFPDDTLGYWLTALWGADDATPDQQAATAAYKHLFVLSAPGVVTPSFTHLVDKGWKQAYYRGSQIGSLSFDIKPGEDNVAAMMTGNFHAWDETAHSGMGAASYGTVRPFSWRDFSCDINDSYGYTALPGIEVEGLSLNIDRQVVPMRGAGNSGLQRQIATTATKVTGSIDVPCSDSFKVEFEDRYRAGTIFTFAMKLASDVIEGAYKYTLELQLPSVVVNVAPPTPIASGLLRSTVSFEHVGRVTAGTLAADPVLSLINTRTATYNK